MGQLDKIFLIFYRMIHLNGKYKLLSMFNSKNKKLLDDLASLLSEPNPQKLEYYFDKHFDEGAEGVLDYLFIELCERYEDTKEYRKCLQYVIS